MQKIEKQLIKIDLPNGLNVSFNERERHISVEIQKIIDSYNQKGFTVIGKDIVNKTSTHATVNFVFQKLN